MKRNVYTILSNFEKDSNYYELFFFYIELVLSYATDSYDTEFFLTKYKIRKFCREICGSFMKIYLGVCSI